MEKNIKDFPNLVKDTRSGAILLKRPKLTIEQIKIKKLEKDVEYLKKEIENIKQKL